MCKGFLTCEGKFSPSLAVRPRGCPGGQLSERAGFMSPSQSAITPWGWSCHTLRGDVDPGEMGCWTRVVIVIEIWKNK